MEIATEDKNEKEQDKEPQVFNSTKKEIKQRALQKKRGDALAATYLIAHCPSADNLNVLSPIPEFSATVPMPDLSASNISALPMSGFFTTVLVSGLSATSISTLLVLKTFTAMPLPSLPYTSILLILEPGSFSAIPMPDLSTSVSALLMPMPGLLASSTAFAILCLDSLLFLH